MRARNGSRLGMVTACGNNQFHIRHGCISPEKYVVPYAEIAEIRRGDIILRRGRESLLDPSQANPSDGPLTHTKPIFLSGETAFAQS